MRADDLMGDVPGSPIGPGASERVQDHHIRDEAPLTDHKTRKIRKIPGQIRPLIFAGQRNRIAVEAAGSQET